jgi:hypothetical protein
MVWMRRLAAAGLAALALSTTACGSAGTLLSASPGDEAARLVPPDAIAFVSVDARLDSEQWRAARELVGPLHLPSGLDDYRDVKPAVGDELNIAVLGVDEGNPEAVALVKPADEAKLRTLVAKLDTADEHYTVRRVGDWSVVADSEDAFAAVRQAEAGRSLADVPQYQRTTAQLGGDALAVAYADGDRLQQLSGELRGLALVAGLPEAVGARVAADDDAVGLQLRLVQRQPAPVYKPRLLRDVPSGAMLAVSFKNPQRLLERLALEPTLHADVARVERMLGISLAELAPALRGESVLYVTQGVLLPTFVLEVEAQQPEAAVRALRRVAAKSTTLPLNVSRRGNRVFLSNGLPLQASGAPKLVDDASFKDALAAADTPQEVTWLAYVDLPRLLPVVQALSQALGGGKVSPADTQRLDGLRNVVAFGARSGSTTRVELRAARR